MVLEGTAELTSQEKSAGDSSTIKRILFNALDHFSRYGYSGASVREITHASQVTKPTLYYYFKNKEELYTKLAETCFEEILGRLTATMALEGTTAERALSLIREYCAICDERRCVARFVHLMSISPDRTAPNVGATSFNLKIGEFFRSIVNDGMRKGELKESDVDAVVYGLFAIFFLRVSNMLANEPIPHDFARVEQAVHRLLV